ncbi:MAG: 2-phospho-L-lactate transferase CofD family protein, partial [Gaiellales bacterium]
TTNALEAVASLGGPEWFLLGDKDIGLHLVRSERLRGGERLSAITADLAHRLDVGVRLLPVTDDPVATSLETSAGTLDFQTYFVKRRHQDTVLAVRYEGAESAAPAPGVLAALEESDVLIVAPSNPYLSIGPILAVEGIARTLARREHPAVAISPIIGGKAVKGPADRMLETFAGEASVVALARHYEGLLTHLLIDDQDAGAVEELEAGGLDVGVTDTLMSDRGARARVAQAAVDLAGVGNDPRPTVDGVSSAGDRDRPRERA